MVIPVLRFNFASPGGEPHQKREMVNAAIEMAVWGSSRGIGAVSVDEHHVTGHGWSSNPVMTAALFLQRTESLFVSVDCALGPLWNPVRLAEDIAFVDALSGGRLLTSVGLGYRSVEYSALGVDFDLRGALLDQNLQTMLSVWSGEALVDDEPGSATASRTWTLPHPPLYVAGGVRATARRAVRFNLGLSLPSYLPELSEYYFGLCENAGVEPALIMPAKQNHGMIYLTEDPDEAWARYGQYILWEAVTYGRWSGSHAPSSMHLPGVESLDQVRASGLYRFLTPEELIAEVSAFPDDYGALVLHPLVGGMPIDEAWRSVQLLADRVLPRIAL